MTQYLKVLFVISAICVASTPARVNAESHLEEKFQDMFVTAGYSAAAGAAIGAAMLTLQDNPGKHLKFISVGASLGFLGGTAFGSWMAIAPMLVENERPSAVPLDINAPSKLIVRPWIDTAKQTVTGVEAGAVLARF